MIKPSQIISTLESNEKILSFKTKDGLPIWFMVRYEVMLAILNQNSKLDVASPNVNRSKISRLKTLIFAFFKSPIFIKKEKIVFFNSGITNIKNSKSNKYFNRVTDSFFFRVKSKALLIEDLASGELRIPRVHEQVYPHLSLIVIAKIFAYFEKGSRDLDQTVSDLIAYIYDELKSSGLEADREILRREICNGLAAYGKNDGFYKIFLKWKKPKVIFLEDASYGSRLFILLNAKRLGIPVVELQHGFVNEEHIAYRLGSGIATHQLTKLFYPDYFLAYGEFWKESINIPSQIFNIGNPYLNSEMHKIQTSQSQRRILFLSSAVAYKEANRFLLKLVPFAERMKYKIVLRLHPVEISAIESRYRVLIDAGITISEESNLYVDLSLSEIIIGELSTALFEALGIKNKKKFLFMSSYAKSYFNDKITIPQVTEDSIEDIFTRDYSESISNYFWSDNWEEKFDSFIRKLV